jgi:hypothetical protein
MSKFIAATVIGLCVILLATSEAQARHGRCRGYATAAPTYAQSMAPAPATAPATAQATTGQPYRTYSYEPAAPVYRSYQAPGRTAPWSLQKTDPRRYDFVR